MSTPRRKSTATHGATTNATTNATTALNQLNKQASSTTGIYQQSVLLRSRLARIPDFAPFLAFSQSGPRASLDVVSQLWQTFAFGVPLCALFNLLEDSKIVDIGAHDIGNLQNLSMNDRKRAVAKFIMAIGTLGDDGRPDNAFPTLSITEVVNLQDTNGFVKLVACLLLLLDRLPEHVWSSELEQSPAEPSGHHDNIQSKEVRTPQEVERANIIRELIGTERKYVQDLEVMLSYAQQLRSQDIVSSDTIHKLFPALSNLTDSQRKFLITTEATFELPWEEQNWGKCFSDHERSFSVYDTYCANCQNAVSTALSEEQALLALAHVISPKELQAFLIKPVQRICKYPLLLGSLLKVTPSDHKHYQALLDGLAAAKRITDTVNNAKRQQENEEVFEALMNRLRDWKGIPINQHSPLLLDDLFAVSSDQNGSGEYHVFLFERLIILCVPAPPDSEKRVTERTSVFKRSASSNALNLQAQASAFLAEGVVVSRKATTQLILKGALYIRSFEDLEAIETGACAFRFRNTGEQPHCVYTFHCTNSEKTHQWHSEIKRQLDRWQKDKEEQRTRTESRPNMVHGERPMYDQVNSSRDSLDLMRAAPRPKHPYASDFRSRSRSNSRVHSRSTSVSSARDGDASVIPDEAFKKLEATVSRRGGTAAYSMPPERDHIEVLVQSGAIEALRARSQTQDGSSFVLWRNQILPPQPPPPQLPQPPLPTSAIRFPSTSVRKLPERRLRARQSSTSTLASADSDSSSNRVGIILGGRRPSVPDLSHSSRTYVPHSGSVTGREPPEGNPMFGASTLGVPAQPRVRNLSNPSFQPIPSDPHVMDGVSSPTAGWSTTNVPQHQPLSRPYDDRSGSQSHRKRSSGSSFDSLESSEVYGGVSSPLTPFSSREGYSLGFSGNTALSAHPYAVPPLASAPAGQTPTGQKILRPPNLRLASSSSDIHVSGVTPPSVTSPRYRPVPVPHQLIGSPGVMSGAASSPTTATSSRLHITVHYGTDHKFILGFLTSTPFEEVVDKMRKKIRICTSSDANGPLRMYYGDDRGGRTALRSMEDYSGALDIVRTRLARGNPTSPGLLVVWVQPDV